MCLNCFIFNQVLQKILSESSISKYLRLVSSEKLNADCWFTRYETYFLSQVLLLPSTEVCNYLNSLLLKF